ncbi:MAG TPA: serine/threonine-protein kinase, partial [Polyangiaceae bacterium]|nr:serine/threonine-protein kinase [Polyangiaceae bacterium]
VVAIVDLGSHEDLHYVVMDYVEGPPFGTLIKRSGAEPNLERALTVVVDTLEGIHAAHTLTDDEGQDLHIVHRDVSPQNILVGVDGVARITDFGIAKAETRISSTRPGTRKGKLAFMSPEQISNDELVDKRADVWAAGVVLWTALAGKNLFRAESDAATMHKVLSKEIPPPSAVGLKPPTFLDAVVMRALQRDPGERYSSALEMADALRNVAAKNGLQCSRQKVASWVGELFSEELALRRQAIRTATRRREEQQEHVEASQINVLPPLPSIVGSSGNLTGTNSNVSGIENYTPISMSPQGFGPGGSRASGMHAGVRALSDQALESRKGRTAIVAGAVVALAVAAFAIGSHLSSKPDVQAPTAQALPLQAVPPAAAVPAAAPPKTEPAREALAAAPAQAAPEAGDDTADEDAEADKSDESRSSSRRKSTARVYRRSSRVNTTKAAAAAPDPALEEAKAAANEEASKGKSTPSPPSGPGFEKNPYVRR